MKKFNEFLLNAGFVYGALTNPDVVCALVEMGFPPEKISEMLALFRDLHAATYYDRSNHGPAR